LHEKPHETPSQVAVAFAGGAGHATQETAPQEFTLVLLTQAPLQLWKPALQVNPHETPLQVAVALAGGTHAVQDTAPHVATLELLTQTPAQLW